MERHALAAAAAVGLAIFALWLHGVMKPWKPRSWAVFVMVAVILVLGYPELEYQLLYLVLMPFGPLLAYFGLFVL